MDKNLVAIGPGTMGLQTSFKALKVFWEKKTEPSVLILKNNSTASCNEAVLLLYIYHNVLNKVINNETYESGEF